MYLLVVVAGCGILDPDEVPPGLLTTPVSGEVINASGGPLVGVRVVTESAPDQSPSSNCAALGPTEVGTETLAASDGQFLTHVRWAAGERCARVFAYIGTGAQATRSDTVIFPLNPVSPGTPRENVILTFAGSP